MMSETHFNEPYDLAQSPVDALTGDEVKARLTAWLPMLLPQDIVDDFLSVLVNETPASRILDIVRGPSLSSELRAVVRARYRGLETMTREQISLLQYMASVWAWRSQDIPCPAMSANGYKLTIEQIAAGRLLGLL